MAFLKTSELPKLSTLILILGMMEKHLEHFEATQEQYDRLSNVACTITWVCSSHDDLYVRCTALLRRIEQEQHAILEQMVSDAMDAADDHFSASPDDEFGEPKNDVPIKKTLDEELEEWEEWSEDNEQHEECGGVSLSETDSDGLKSSI